MIATGSFLVAGSNAVRIPMAHALGEEAYFQLVIEQTAKVNFWPGWLGRMAPALFYAFLALFVFFFFQTPDTWGFWIAYGIVAYVFAYLIHGTTSFLRLRKLGKAKAESK